MMFKLCRHDWEKIADFSFRSPWELMEGEKRVDAYMPWLFMRKQAVLLACKKCGKIKLFEVTSSD